MLRNMTLNDELSTKMKEITELMIDYEMSGFVKSFKRKTISEIPETKAINTLPTNIQTCISKFDRNLLSATFYSKQKINQNGKENSF